MIMKNFTYGNIISEVSSTVYKYRIHTLVLLISGTNILKQNNLFFLFDQRKALLFWVSPR